MVGAYDCIAKTKKMPSADLGMFIKNEIRNQENIMWTLTLKSIKEEFE